MTKAGQRLAGTRWGRVLLAGGLAFVSGLIVVAVVVTGYAVKLGFEARGAPDSGEIQAFADRVAPILGPLMGLLATFVAAWFAARRTVAAVRHGVLVGAMVALLDLLIVVGAGQPFRAGLVLEIVGLLAAGWAGGRLAAPRGGRPAAAPAASTDAEG